MKVSWSQAARRDVRRITAFYRAIDPQLSIDMRHRIEAAPTDLFDHPGIASPFHGSTRKWKIKNTPLLLFFATKGRTMVVKGVAHEREDWFSEP